MRQRYADLEANMLANLQAMREHREAMDKVKEQRNKDREKALEEMRTSGLEQSSSDCDVSGPLVGVPCVRTLKDRFRALEENAYINGEAITERRKILDDVAILKQQQEERATLAKEAADAAAEAAQLDRCGMIETNARKLQTSESARKLQATDSGYAIFSSMIVRDAREVYQARLSSRPTSATTHCSSGSSLPRPTSAGSYYALTPARGTVRRPNARASSSSAASRPSSAMQSAPSTRPSSAARPSSAYTLKGRLQSLQVEATRNQNMLNAHREVLIDVEAVRAAGRKAQEEQARATRAQ